MRDRDKPDVKPIQLNLDVEYIEYIKLIQKRLIDLGKRPSITGAIKFALQYTCKAISN